jgi:hypothetical protein
MAVAMPTPLSTNRLRGVPFDDIVDPGMYGRQRFNSKWFSSKVGGPGVDQQDKHQLRNS